MVDSAVRAFSASELDRWVIELDQRMSVIEADSGEEARMKGSNRAIFAWQAMTRAIKKALGSGVPSLRWIKTCPEVPSRKVAQQNRINSA
jgi:hypothetical protein